MTTTAAAGTTPQAVVSGTTPLPSSGSSGSLSSNTGATLAGNFQTFLTLLTTQLKNQNPLSPLDTNQFTQQLVQFAGVEQQLKTNDELSSLIAAQQATQSTQALGFVGRTAVVDGNTTALTNHSATWNLNVPANSNLHITITNAAGGTVLNQDFGQVASGPNQAFPWNGIGDSGEQWADGNYTLTATATDGTGATVGVPVQIRAPVNSVDLTQSPPLLSIGGQNYTINQIKSIVN
jgi:flagellar basal-body rod modification protein FlgD